MTLIFKSRHFKRTLLVILVIGGMWYMYATKGQDSKRKEVRRDGALTLQDRMQEILAAREWLAENSVRMGYNSQGTGTDPYSPNRLFNNAPPRTVYRVGSNDGGAKSGWSRMIGPFVGASGDLDHFRHGDQDSRYPDGGSLGIRQQRGGGGSDYDYNGEQAWAGQAMNMRRDSSGHAFNLLQEDRSKLFNSNNNDNNNVGYRIWNTNAYENQLLNSPFNNIPVNPNGYQTLNQQNSNVQPPFPKLAEQEFTQFVPKPAPSQDSILGFKTNLNDLSDTNIKNTITSKNSAHIAEPVVMTLSDKDNDKKVDTKPEMTVHTPNKGNITTKPSQGSLPANISKPAINRSKESKTNPSSKSTSEIKNEIKKVVTGNNPKKSKSLSASNDVIQLRDHLGVPPLAGQSPKTLHSRTSQLHFRPDNPDPSAKTGFQPEPSNVNQRSPQNVPQEKPVYPPTNTFQDQVNQASVKLPPGKSPQTSIQLAAKPLLPEIPKAPIVNTEPQSFVKRFLSRFFTDTEEPPQNSEGQAKPETSVLLQRLGQSSGTGPQVGSSLDSAFFNTGPDRGVVNSFPSQLQQRDAFIKSRRIPPPLQPALYPQNPPGSGNAIMSGNPPGSRNLPGFGNPLGSATSLGISISGSNIQNPPALGVQARVGTPTSLKAGFQQGKMQIVDKKNGGEGEGPQGSQVKKGSTSPGDLHFVTMVTRDKTRWKEELCPQANGLRPRTLRTPLGDVKLYTEAGSNVTDTDVNNAFGVEWNMHGVGTLFDRCFPPGGNISLVDIGSGVGTVAFTAARVASDVYAIEPVNELVYAICNSVKDMHYDNVHVVHNAVSDDRGKVSFRKRTKSESHTSSYVVDTRNKSKVDPNSPTAFAIKLDDILRLYKITKAVVKIDVESFEGRTLAGANKFLNTVDIPCILMEWKNVHYLKDFGGNYVFDILSNHGFFPHDINTLLPLKVFRMHEWPPEVLWAKIGSAPVKL